ncbi:MAG: methyltransferase [Luminiphilus sp.]|nr:methyltransferase [Luminiphilus sp.]
MSVQGQLVSNDTPGYSTSWRLRWHQYRNKLIANPRFQKWAARTPLVRLIANRRATQLHHITAGFVYSQTLAAFVELDIPNLLADGPAQTDRLISATGIPEPALLTLLKAAKGLGLLECYEGNIWGLGELGAAMLANPGIAAMVRHHQHLYADLSDPTALLRQREKTALANYWAYGDVKKGDISPETYSELMATSQGMIADYVLDTVDFNDKARLVDIAGGTGAFARRAVARFPNLRATVYDLPAVTEQAAVAHNSNDTPHALQYQGGDMFEDPLPEQADIMSLVRVLHDHDDKPAQHLINKAFQALSLNGQLMVAEPMAETPGSESIGHTYFGFYLWAMGSGRPRTSAELTSMMKIAGFNNVREAKSPMPSLVRVLIGDKINA